MASDQSRSDEGTVSLGRELRKAAWKVSMLGLSRGPHITRYQMYRRLGEVGETLPRLQGPLLSISHSAALIDVLGIQPEEVFDADYPDHNMLSLQFADDSFDWVVSDQVLEHVEGSPYQATAECHRILRTGGIAIHTTCFINPVHGAPDDFWRFTPNALALLHHDWSEVIEVGGWGNFETWLAVRDGMRRVGVPHARWHPLHRRATRNDPRWPIVTWVIARK